MFVIRAFPAYIARDLKHTDKNAIINGFSKKDLNIFPQRKGNGAKAMSENVERLWRKCREKILIVKSSGVYSGVPRVFACRLCFERSMQRRRRGVQGSKMDVKNAESEGKQDEVHETEPENGFRSSENEDEEAEEEEENEVSIEATPPFSIKDDDKPPIKQRIPKRRGRPPKSGKRIDSEPTVGQSVSSFFSSLAGVPEEDYSDTERAMFALIDQDEQEDWKVVVTRVWPKTLQNGTPCTGICQDFPISYHAEVQSFIKRFYGGGKFRIEIRRRGVRQKTGTFEVCEKPRIPTREELNDYFERGDRGMRNNPEREKEREDLIRENAQLRAETKAETAKREMESLRTEFSNKHTEMLNEIRRIAEKPNDTSKRTMAEELATLTVALEPILTALLTRNNPPQQNDQNHELMSRIDKLENDKYVQLLEKISENMGGSKKDPMMGKIMEAVISKAFGENQTDKFLNEVMPNTFKQLSALQKEAFRDMAEARSSIGGGGGDDEFSWKDVGSIVKDVLSPGPMQMMPPGMMPPQQRLPAPVPGVPPQYPPRQPPQGGPPTGAGFPPQPEAAASADAQGEKSSIPAGHKVNPAVGQMAAEFFQTGRTGQRFAETLEAANTTGNLISPFLLDMIGSADPATAKKHIYDFVTNQPGPLSQQLAKDLKTAEGQKFLDEAIEYFKEE